MIIGIGMDLVEIARIDAAVKRHGTHFLERIFTPAELEYCTGKTDASMYLAARFAAKEACAKALGSGIGSMVGWRDMEVVRDAAGKPDLVLTGRAAHSAAGLEVGSIFVTLTHTSTHAAAVVVLER